MCLALDSTRKDKFDFIILDLLVPLQLSEIRLTGGGSAASAALAAAAA